MQEEETGSGSEVGTGGAEALLNNETLLNESLWNDGKRLWRWTLCNYFLFQGESSRGGVARPHPINDR